MTPLAGLGLRPRTTAPPPFFFQNPGSAPEYLVIVNLHLGPYRLGVFKACRAGTLHGASPADASVPIIENLDYIIYFTSGTEIAVVAMVTQIS